MSEAHEKTPLVSILMPTFNQEEFIGEAIDSCLAQTYDKIEIIVADDASTDGTRGIIENYAERFKDKVKLVFNEKNLGVTGNVNEALKSCRGKYIAFTAGDDLFLPDKIAKQVSLMEADPECVICYHNLEVFDSTTHKTLGFYNEIRHPEGNIRTVIRKHSFNGGCSTMVRKLASPVSGHDTRLKIGGEWLYWIDCLSTGGKILYINEVLGRYRRHPGNLTKERAWVREDQLDALITCQILLAKYPEYYWDIMFIYSKILFGLRYKLGYYRTVMVSFMVRPNLKSALALALYCFSLGRFKL